jgi:hypothetical protein
MENGDLRVRNRRHEVKTSPRMAHSSSPEEKLGFPFSENGPSAIQGEGATTPFSDLGEWRMGGRGCDPNRGCHTFSENGEWENGE